MPAPLAPNVTLENIRQAATNLRRAYHERGWVTVAVSLPAQRLTNATVRLAVTEGKLASVQIVGNEHFSSENILRALPDLQTNTLLNSHIFQRELDAANQNRDRQIYPTLGPGPEAGTSALTLRVQDRLPLHAHLETDNYNTPGTPDWRVNAAVQYNNLWQREQQAGLAYSFSPQEFKTMDNTPDFGLNQPLISSYSAFYRIPFPSSETTGRQIAASSRFGYQEATHQFLLPPAQTESELTFYASASATDTGVKWGTPTTITSSSLLTIVSQDSQQSTANNENVGSQFQFPLVSGEHSRLSGFLGLDFKQAGMSGYSTNNFFITTVTTNQFGGQTNRSVASKGQPGTSSRVVYFPINLGVDFSETGPARFHDGQPGAVRKLHRQRCGFCEVSLFRERPSALRQGQLDGQPRTKTARRAARCWRGPADRRRPARSSATNNSRSAASTACAVITKATNTAIAAGRAAWNCARRILKRGSRTFPSSFPRGCARACSPIAGRDFCSNPAPPVRASGFGARASGFPPISIITSKRA